MGLEAGNFIADLVEANPLGTDPKSQGDDHLRLIKKCIRQTFPGFTAAITPTFAQLNKLQPAGAPEFLSIELGHASDTTLARVAAGRASIEGKEIANLSDSQTYAGVPHFSNANPRLRLHYTGGAADTKYTELEGQGQFSIRFLDDAAAAPVAALAIGRAATIPAAWDLRGTVFRFNRQENAPTELRLGEPSTLRGNSQDSTIIFYGENAGAIGSVTLSFTGTQLQATTSNASAWSFNLSTYIAAGNIFRQYDVGNTKYMQTSHDGTNYLHALTGGGNVIMSGMTAVQLPQVELGHASDTTISRVSAGVIAVEGVNVLTTATGKKQGRCTLPIMAAAMTPSSTNGAALGSTETTTNKQNFKTLDFDQTTQEFACFQVPMPKSWNLGTITFEPIWTAAAGTGGVVWELEAVAISDDDVLDAAFGTAQSSTDTLIATTDLHRGPESAAITVAGTPAAGDTVFFRIKRAPANASDTLTADAKLIGIRIFYTDNAADDA